MSDSSSDILIVTARIRIPRSEFQFSFSRSSGPGGQNVNKVSSRATLRWDLAGSPSISNALRERFQARFHQRINAKGELLIHSERYRDQPRNVDDCLEKLKQLIAEVASPPKKRRPTKPTRSSNRRRLEQKKRRAQTKQRRSRPRNDD